MAMSDKQGVLAGLIIEDNASKARRRGRSRKSEDAYFRRRLTGEEHWSKVLQVNGGSPNFCLKRNNGCVRNVVNESHSPKPRRMKRSKSLGRTGEGLLFNLTNRFRQWVQSKRKYEISPTDDVKTEDRPTWRDPVFNDDVTLRSYRASLAEQSVTPETVQEKEIPEILIVEISQPDVACDDVNNDNNILPSEIAPTLHQSSGISARKLLRASRYKHKERLLSTGAAGKQPLTETISCPPKPGLLTDDKETSSWRLARRRRTWPLPGRRHKKEGYDDSEEIDLSFLTEDIFERGSVLRGKKSLEDFSIQFEDLDIEKTLRVGRKCKIFSGRWHGDVTVHLFGEMKEEDTDTFWSNLSKLCRIRHENINLFMGACTDPPNLAVITSNPTGMSLYENMHHTREKLNVHAKVQILRQIAIGMGYLHAKGIVLRKLNTKNIFLSSKVKISAMDYGIAESRCDRSKFASIPRGHLSYVAPEILCTLRIVPPRLVTSSAYTNETDVFAFGTVMYEVLSGSFPYEDVPVESVIWQVSKGRRQNLSSLVCSAPLKVLIEDCWAHEPFYRPDFPELSKELHKNSPMYKRHSSSEPERLHRTGSLMDRLW